LSADCASEAPIPRIKAPRTAHGPWAEADVTQGFEGHFEQRVSAFADGPDAVVNLVVGFVDVGQFAVFGFLNATVMVSASPS
jgi:hypothetical protein